MERFYSAKIIAVSGLIALLIGIAVGEWHGRSSVDNDLSPTPIASVTSLPLPNTTPTTITVHLRPEGPDPRQISIKRGDTVVFENVRQTAFWPVGSSTDRDSACSDFNAQRALRNGDTYTFVFSRLGTCAYGDNLQQDVADQGMIYIQ